MGDPNAQIDIIDGMDVDIMNLVRDAREGKGAAVAAVIEEILPDVRAYVRVNAGADIRARESMSDVVQSICREILEDIGEFRGEQPLQFKKWLFTLALNKVRDRHRFLKAQRRNIDREEAMHTGFDQLMQCYSRIYTPSRIAQAREDVSVVESALSQLSDDFREVLTKRCMLRLSHKEIAEDMGRSENAVQKLLTRARAKLSMLIAKAELANED